jgi:TatD DNase family protein
MGAKPLSHTIMRSDTVVPLIDVHAHLTDPAFQDLPEVMRRSRAAGVKKIIMSITDPAEFGRARENLLMTPGYLHLTVGFDPTDLSEERYAKFKELIDQGGIIGVGEVGLDHFYVRDHSQRALQESLFRSSIRLALERDLPLVVHSRSAGHDALEVLYSEGAERVLMHAFDGRSGDALAAAKRGFFFSIPTSVVHSEQKQKLARFLPLESLMLETDSPVLSPVRGERNEPANLIYAARKISEIKRIELGEVIRTTTEKAKELFRI